MENQFVRTRSPFVFKMFSNSTFGQKFMKFTENVPFLPQIPVCLLLLLSVFKRRINEKIWIFFEITGVNKSNQIFRTIYFQFPNNNYSFAKYQEEFSFNLRVVIWMNYSSIFCEIQLWNCQCSHILTHGYEGYAVIICI